MALLRKASKKQAKIKLALSAPTGFGKTYSALLLAKGLVGSWDKIAVIDTENESADLYSDLGGYFVVPMKPPYTVDSFKQAVKSCVNEGIECVIVDSTYHYWHGKGGLLEYNSNLGGNSFANWAKTNPLYSDFLDTILQTNAHFICTSRKKQAYEIVENNGKKSVEKKGMEDQIRDGFDYEMTIAFNIVSANHLVEVSKDRTRLFTDKQSFVITEKTGEEIKAWCETGVDESAAITDAVTKLASCNTVDELSALKIELPSFVIQSPQFIATAKERYKVIIAQKKTDAPAQTQNGLTDEEKAEITKEEADLFSKSNKK